MSATPWSLLTDTSRFPTERIGHNTQTGRIEFIHEITQERNYANPSNFFHVKWSMAHKKEYEKGRKVRLQVRLFKISTLYVYPTNILRRLLFVLKLYHILIYFKVLQNNNSPSN